MALLGSYTVAFSGNLYYIDGPLQNKFFHGFSLLNHFFQTFDQNKNGSRFLGSDRAFTILNRKSETWSKAPILT